MQCQASTVSGRPCRKQTKKVYCSIHEKIELNNKMKSQTKNLKGLNRRIEQSRDKIADLVNECNLNASALEEANKQINELKDQIEIKDFEISQMKDELDEYRTIKKFEALNNKVKEICDTYTYAIIQSHLKLKFSRTRGALIRLLGPKPYETFNKLREERNALAHKF